MSGPSLKALRVLKDHDLDNLVIRVNDTLVEEPRWDPSPVRFVEELDTWLVSLVLEVYPDNDDPEDDDAPEVAR